MKNYVSSDLHFSHKNIIKYCPDSRGHLNSVGEMNEVLINNFNNVLTEEDHIYLLGDIGFGSPESTMEFLKRINGTKTIIHGNHDRKLIASPIFRNPSERRLAGIIEDTPYKVISQTIGGKKYGVVLFHFRIAEWDGMHHGSIHLFGHSHGTGPEQPGRCQDIGVDTNNLMPYNLEDILRKLSNKPMTFSGHHDGARE